MSPPRTTVIVFAKAPVPGYAKTRLIPALGPDGAAALAERLLRHAIGSALEAGLGPVELCATPDTHHPAFAALDAAVERQVQGDGDLGARMARAFARRLGGDERPGDTTCLLIGTDAPGLDAAYLRAAADALATHDAVFGPALDGGYTLVGLRRPAPALFNDMAWSTPTVMADTRTRLAAAGLRHAELAPLSDIDEPADLVHLPPGWDL